MTTTRALFGTAAAVLLGLLAPATAEAVGATPGVALGGDGASWQGHTQRFVTVPAPGGTLVTELRRAGGATLHSRTIAGRFGIPLVTYNASSEEVPATSPTMVVAERASPAALPRRTSFVVLSTRDLHVVRRITLGGAFAFDALSPNGATMYLTQHASRAQITRYTVRAYDIRTGHLLPGVIADKTEHEWRMDGLPVSRAQTADGGWAYTLYQGGEDGAFVHALDTRTRTAHCTDIPGMTTQDVMSMRLRLTDGGRRLAIVSGPKAVSAVDTGTFALVPAGWHPRTEARPRKPAAGTRADSPSSSSGSGTNAWAIGVAAVLLAGAGLVGLRRRMPHNPAHGGRS
jgi:hypothetical protein